MELKGNEVFDQGRQNQDNTYSPLEGVRLLYNYFEYYCNRSKLTHFYCAVKTAMFTWLNRRSQRKSLTWKQFGARLLRKPLPTPPTATQLKQLGWSPYVK